MYIGCMSCGCACADAVRGLHREGVVAEGLPNPCSSLSLSLLRSDFTMSAAASTSKPPAKDKDPKPKRRLACEVSPSPSVLRTGARRREPPHLVPSGRGSTTPLTGLPQDAKGLKC